jgi:L-2-hydroxyglutarate oxidase LhgO
VTITVNTFVLDAYRADAGQVDGSEVIYKLNASQVYTVECVVTAAGTASLKVMTDTDQPTDFSAMSTAFDGTQSGNFIRRVTGCSYVGLDAASGTWTVKVRRV